MAGVTGQLLGCLSCVCGGAWGGMEPVTRSPYLNFPLLFGRPPSLRPFFYFLSTYRHIFLSGERTLFVTHLKMYVLWRYPLLFLEIDNAV